MNNNNYYYYDSQSSSSSSSSYTDADADGADEERLMLLGSSTAAAAHGAVGAAELATLGSSHDGAEEELLQQSPSHSGAVGSSRVQGAAGSSSRSSSSSNTMASAPGEGSSSSSSSSSSSLLVRFDFDSSCPAGRLLFCPPVVAAAAAEEEETVESASSSSTSPYSFPPLSPVSSPDDDDNAPPVIPDLYHTHQNHHQFGAAAGGPRILATPVYPNLENDRPLLRLLAADENNSNGSYMFLQACQVFNRATAMHSLALQGQQAQAQQQSLVLTVDDTCSSSTPNMMMQLAQARNLYQIVLVTLHRMLALTSDNNNNNNNHYDDKNDDGSTTTVSPSPTTSITLLEMLMRLHNNLGCLVSMDAAAITAHVGAHSSVDDTPNDATAARSYFSQALVYSKLLLLSSLSSSSSQASSSAAATKVPSVPHSTTTISTSSSEHHIDILTTTPCSFAFHQLERATILSNWCCVDWMKGNGAATATTVGTATTGNQNGGGGASGTTSSNSSSNLAAATAMMDETLYQNLSEVLRIRSALLPRHHVDGATAHYHLSVVEYMRGNNSSAMHHLMEYLNVATGTASKNSNSNTLDCNETSQQQRQHHQQALDPVPALIFLVLLHEEQVSRDSNNTDAKGDGEEDNDINRHNDIMSQQIVQGIRRLEAQKLRAEDEGRHGKAAAVDQQRPQQQHEPSKMSHLPSILHFFGTLLLYKSNLDYALVFFKEELRLQEALDVQAATMLSSGDRLRVADQQQRQQQEQVMRKEKIKRDLSVSVTCNNIGHILQEMGRYEEAIVYYELVGLRINVHHDNDYCTSSNTITGAKEGLVTSSSSSRNAPMRTARKRKVCDISSTTNGGADDQHGPPPRTTDPMATTTTTINLDDVDLVAQLHLQSTAWYNLGLIYNKLGSFDKAIVALRQSLDLKKLFLSRDHADISCLYYNIGVLQMEHGHFHEASESLKESLRHRRYQGGIRIGGNYAGASITTSNGSSSSSDNKGSASGQLNDERFIKTLEKLAMKHQEKGHFQAAIDTWCQALRVLEASTEYDAVILFKDMGLILRFVSELYIEMGYLMAALLAALQSVRLLDSIAAVHCQPQHDTATLLKEKMAIIEQLITSLLLVGSIHHEMSEPVKAEIVLRQAVLILLCTIAVRKQQIRRQRREQGYESDSSTDGYTSTTHEDDDNSDDEDDDDLVHSFPLSSTLAVLREIAALLAITQCAPVA
jgi:tetratricopeptide (TPR) repeat protein